MDDTTALTKLGSSRTEYKTSDSNASLLEVFPNRHPDSDYTVTHECMEFSSLCPKTGQPDFGNITIKFVPDKVCVETKSLKLYLFAYRNEGCFMETLTGKIFKDLKEVMQPRSLSVEAVFRSRGGIQTIVRFGHSEG